MQHAAESLSERRFSAIAQFVEQEVGIKLPSSKRVMVEGRLRRRVRALNLRNLEDYAAHLFDRGNLGTEAASLVDCVTTNKTDFFREPAHFDFLCRTAIPDLIDAQPDRTIKIWSAASSIGAEAFTIAMVLQDMIAAGARFRFSILGTDVSGQVIEQGRTAIYPEAMVEPVPAASRRKYVMPSRQSSESLVRIVPELRRRVQFHQLNLMDETYPVDRDVDVIFCRNVLIYFEKQVQAAVIGRLADHLRPGGYLILGHSESMAGGDVQGLAPILPTIYRREGRRG